MYSIPLYLSKTKSKISNASITHSKNRTNGKIALERRDLLFSYIFSHFDCRKTTYQSKNIATKYINEYPHQKNYDFYVKFFLQTLDDSQMQQKLHKTHKFYKENWNHQQTIKITQNV